MANNILMMQEMMKTQMLMKLGDNANPMTTMAFMTAFDFIQKNAGFYILKAFEYISTKCRRPKGPIETCKKALLEPKSKITYEKIYIASGQDTKTKIQTKENNVDSILAYIASLRNITSLTCIQGDLIPNIQGIINVSNDVYFKIEKMNFSEGSLSSIRFDLLAYEHDAIHIQTFVDECIEYWERKVKNKLGNYIYFFDQMNEQVMNSLPSARHSSGLGFTKNKFFTSRSFDNVYFDQREIVSGRVNHFLTNREWYEQRGIPYTLGFMFYGSAGVGKTSCIKAIANITKRHIINVHLSDIKTNSQLKALFYNDELPVLDNNGRFETINIPLNQRLYLIEDIDAMESVVLKRDKIAAPKIDPSIPNYGRVDTPVDPIDLSTLLNILDGTLELPGRILIVSSNYPERLDQALIRPGRIDMCVKFTKCSTKMLEQMFEGFYGSKYSVITIKEYKWTPAEAIQILFQNFSTPLEAIKTLSDKTPKELFPHSYMKDGEDVVEEKKEEEINKEDIEINEDDQSEKKSLDSSSETSEPKTPNKPVIQRDQKVLEQQNVLPIKVFTEEQKQQAQTFLTNINKAVIDYIIQGLTTEQALMKFMLINKYTEIDIRKIINAEKFYNIPLIECLFVGSQLLEYRDLERHRPSLEPKTPEEQKPLSQTNYKNQFPEEVLKHAEEELEKFQQENKDMVNKYQIMNGEQKSVSGHERRFDFLNGNKKEEESLKQFDIENNISPAFRQLIKEHRQIPIEKFDLHGPSDDTSNLEF